MAGGQEQGQRTGMGARPCAFSSQYTVRNVMTSVERRNGTRHLGVIGMEADKALAALREVLADVRGTMKLISPWSRLAAEAGLNGRLLVARDKLAEAIILPLELLQPTDMQLRCFFRLITACSCGSRELVWGSASYVLWQSPGGTQLQRNGTERCCSGALLQRVPSGSSRDRMGSRWRLSTDTPGPPPSAKAAAKDAAAKEREKGETLKEQEAAKG